jgi:uncharacterized protein
MTWGSGMIELPDHLLSNEKKAIVACTSSLVALLLDNLVTLWLFGSKARGDFDSDSDIDLLVIVHHLDPETRWSIRAVAADCSLYYDVLFNTHIVEKHRWQKIVQQQDTLWREIEQDGIALPALATVA